MDPSGHEIFWLQLAESNPEILEFGEQERAYWVRQRQLMPRMPELHELFYWQHRWRDLRTGGTLNEIEDLAPHMLAPELSDEQGVGVSERSRALSLLLWKDAQEQTATNNFRTGHLARERVLKPDAVEAWLEEVAQSDGPATLFSRGRPAEDSPVAELEPVLRPGAMQPLYGDPGLRRLVRFDELHYGVPTSRWTQRIPVKELGTLDQLRRQSEGLAKRYGWTTAQATLFLLTDLAPLVNEIECRVRPFPAPIRGRTRVVLEVDPQLTPGQVAAAFREERNRLLGRGTRSLSDKHLRLAQIWALREERSGELMKVWNETYPNWGYDSLTQFNRDVSVARRRVVDPAYPEIAGVGDEVQEGG